MSALSILLMPSKTKLVVYVPIYSVILNLNANSAHNSLSMYLIPGNANKLKWLLILMTHIKYWWVRQKLWPHSNKNNKKSKLNSLIYGKYVRTIVHTQTTDRNVLIAIKQLHISITQKNNAKTALNIMYLTL